MTIFGSSCGSCPDPGYVNQTIVAGNAPVIGAGGPPAAGADPSASPQTVINVYDDKVRIFVSNDGVTWSHSDLNSLTCEDLNTCFITNLSDVDTLTTPPTSGQFLQWDGADWVPAAQTDVHFLNTDLTAIGVREHVIDGNSFRMFAATSALDGAVIEMNNSLVALQGGILNTGNTCSINLNTAGMNLVFGGLCDLKVEGTAGVSGQVLTTNGADLPPSWSDIPENSNITTGTVAPATGSRTIDFGGGVNYLNLDNLYRFYVNTTDNIELTGDIKVYGPSSTAGEISLFAPNGADSVKLVAPNDIGFVWTLPGDYPSSNGQVMSFTTGGVASFADQIDTNITTGIVAAATGTRNIDLGGNDLNFNSVGAYNITASGQTYIETSYFGVSNNGTSGVFRLYDADDSAYVAIQPRTAVTGTYTITLPAAAPSANNQVMSFQTNGLADFVDPPNITTGTLAAATGNRTVDMGSNNLNFNNALAMSVNSSTSIGLTSSTVNFQGTGASQAIIALFDGNNSNEVYIQPPTDVTSTYTWTLPPAGPSANDQVMKFTSLGVASFGTDEHFLNTDLTATTDRTHELSQNRLTINGDGVDACSFVIDNQGIFIYGGSNTNNAEVNVDSSGIDLRFAGSTHLAIEGSSGSSGQVLTSQGFGSAPAWVTPQANHTVTYVDDSLNAYDTVADNGSGNGGPSNRPGSPIEGDEVIELYSNGILKEIYDGSQWVSAFNISCCSAATLALTNGTLSPLDPEVPTTSEIQTYYDALGDSAKGVGTIATYTSPLGRYYSWIIDVSGDAVLQEAPSLTGFSDEGTISGIPASVSVGLKRTYVFDVNTVAGNVNLSAMNTVTGVPDGAELVFRNTGENDILFDQDINGSTVQYTASGAGSTLRIFYSTSGTGNHQAG